MFITVYETQIAVWKVFFSIRDCIEYGQLGDGRGNHGNLDGDHEHDDE